MAALPPSVPSSRPLLNDIYEPLDLTSKQPSIRLAILRAAPREANIRITLAHATFASRPRYEALSYTWGKPEPVKAIELNGITVQIRENLWLALVHLQDAGEERILWIDAICIKRADGEERNRQVRLAAYIYSRAKEVIVWLGPQQIPLHESEFLELCNRPYWRRVWIVQEIGAATRLRVRWGNASASWDGFFQHVSARYAEPQIAPATKLFRSRHGRHGDNFLLANLMETCKDSLCEEPRDKVYGYVGIAHDSQDGSFPFDYSKSLFELYEDVIWFQYRSVKLSIILIIHFSQLVQRLLGGPKQYREISRGYDLDGPSPSLPPSPSTRSRTYSESRESSAEAYPWSDIHMMRSLVFQTPQEAGR